MRHDANTEIEKRFAELEAEVERLHRENEYMRRALEKIAVTEDGSRAIEDVSEIARRALAAAGPTPEETPGAFGGPVWNPAVFPDEGGNE